MEWSALPVLLLTIGPSGSQDENSHFGNSVSNSMQRIDGCITIADGTMHQGILASCGTGASYYWIEALSYLVKSDDGTAKPVLLQLQVGRNSQTLICWAQKIEFHLTAIPTIIASS